MPKATTCELNGRVISVEEALRLRSETGRRGSYPAFSCLECGEYVRPHKEGTTGQAAHFEHKKRNPGCSQGT